jgi:membrane protein YdbS with pleckstrin-like domain
LRIGQEFTPAFQLKKLFYIYLSIITLFILGIVSIPVFFVEQIVAAILFAAMILPIIIIFLITAWWIPKYYKTIIYKLTNTEISWRRGVWFKKTGLVPYNRITNIDIVQGPVSRKLGIGSLKIQTAGYSATSGAASEIRLDGIEDFEGLRETIMRIVRGKKPVAVETYEGESSNEVLKELVKIRKLLEKK